MLRININKNEDFRNIKLIINFLLITDHSIFPFFLMFFSYLFFPKIITDEIIY